MLTKKEKVHSLVHTIKEKFFENELFKYNNLKEFEIDSPIFKIKNFEYAYGFDFNSFGYYFIAVNKEREGFIWIRSSLDEFEFNQVEEKVFSTKNFKHIDKVFKERMDIEFLKQYYVCSININTLKEVSYSTENVLANINFSMKTINRKPLRAKVIGLMALLLSSEVKNGFSKECAAGFINIYPEYKDRLSFDDPVDLINDLYDLISLLIVENIEYIVWHDIDLDSIYSKIYDYFLIDLLTN
jgi:hypothetical protein